MSISKPLALIHNTLSDSWESITYARQCVGRPCDAIIWVREPATDEDKACVEMCLRHGEEQNVDNVYKLDELLEQAAPTPDRLPGIVETDAVYGGGWRR